MRIRDVIFFFISLTTYFVPTRSAYLDYTCNLFNLHVAMCDNENVVTDEVKLINQLKKGSPERNQMSLTKV